MSEPNFHIVPDTAIAVHTRVEAYGRMTFEGKRGYGARLRADTRCDTCGKAFKSGDAVEADLRENWDEAPWRHRTTCPPGVVGNQPKEQQ